MPNSLSGVPKLQVSIFPEIICKMWFTCLFICMGIFLGVGSIALKRLSNALRSLSSNATCSWQSQLHGQQGPSPPAVSLATFPCDLRAQLALNYYSGPENILHNF